MANSLQEMFGMQQNAAQQAYDPYNRQLSNQMRQSADVYLYYDAATNTSRHCSEQEYRRYCAERDAAAMSKQGNPVPTPTKPEPNKVLLLLGEDE